MAVIDEVDTENGGTLFMDNIKVNVKDRKKRDSEAASALEKQKRVVSEPRAIPNSVDLLLKKQDKLAKDILYGNKHNSNNKPQFVSGGKLKSQADEEDRNLDVRLKELREINQQLALPQINKVKNSGIYQSSDNLHHAPLSERVERLKRQRIASEAYLADIPQPNMNHLRHENRYGVPATSESESPAKRG